MNQLEQSLMRTLELRVSKTEFSAMMTVRVEIERATPWCDRQEDRNVDHVVQAMITSLKGKIGPEHPIPYTTYKIVVVEPASILDEIPRIKDGQRQTEYELAMAHMRFVQRGLGMVSRGEIDHQGFAIAMMREFEGRFGWTLESEQPPRAVALRSLVEERSITSIAPGDFNER